MLSVMKKNTSDEIIYKITRTFRILSIVALTIDLICLLTESIYRVVISSHPLQNELFHMIKIGLSSILYCSIIIFIQRKNKKILIFLLILYIVGGILEFLFLIISFFGMMPTHIKPIEITIIIAQNVCRICCYFFIFIYVNCIKKEEELLTYQLNEDFINTLGYTIKSNVKNKIESSLLSDSLFPNGETFSDKNSIFKLKSNSEK